MYLKTPKRYSAKGRKRYLFSYRRLGFWLLAGLLIFGGWLVYRDRARYAPVVSDGAEALFYAGQEMVNTMQAPTPLPTENPVNVVNRADANWLGGRVEDAIDDYTIAVTALPNDVVTHYRFAMSLIIEGEYNKALTAAENAITADPYSPDAWAVKALAQVRTGDAGGAIASAQHALSFDPNHAAAYAFLTEAYLDLELIERAEEAAARAVELNPDSAEAYIARAQVQQLVNFDLESAVADYQTAYQIANHRVDAAVTGANLAAFTGDTDGAIAILNEVKDANPDNPTVLGTLGIIYNRDVGDPNQAADTLARCVDVAPGNSTCHFEYGRVLLRLEQYNQAAVMLERALDLTMAGDDPDPRYHYWAGEAQIYLGNCPTALTYLEQGYTIADENGQDQIASDLQGSIQECSAFDVVPIAPTATPTSTLQPQNNVGDTIEPDAQPTAAPNA